MFRLPQVRRNLLRRLSRQHCPPRPPRPRRQCHRLRLHRRWHHQIPPPFLCSLHLTCHQLSLPCRRLHPLHRPHHHTCLPLPRRPRLPCRRLRLHRLSLRLHRHLHHQALTLLLCPLHPPRRQLRLLRRRHRLRHRPHHQIRLSLLRHPCLPRRQLCLTRRRLCLPRHRLRLPRRRHHQLHPQYLRRRGRPRLPLRPYPHRPCCRRPRHRCRGSPRQSCHPYLSHIGLRLRHLSGRPRRGCLGLCLRLHHLVRQCRRSNRPMSLPSRYRHGHHSLLHHRRRACPCQVNPPHHPHALRLRPISLRGPSSHHFHHSCHRCLCLALRHYRRRLQRHRRRRRCYHSLPSSSSRPLSCMASFDSFAEEAAIPRHRVRRTSRLQHEPPQPSSTWNSTTRRSRRRDWTSSSPSVKAMVCSRACAAITTLLTALI
mmetsp:Transcript_15757/g.47805  ORF Transcript_15757/g.47805 Transcript_15757/m.47805 type:complete len:427 (+) Transcript_15757:1764-3044(+)